jgi:hypothetical protein
MEDGGASTRRFDRDLNWFGERGRGAQRVIDLRIFDGTEIFSG